MTEAVRGEISGERRRVWVAAEAFKCRLLCVKSVMMPHENTRRRLRSGSHKAAGYCLYLIKVSRHK